MAGAPNSCPLTSQHPPRSTVLSQVSWSQARSSRGLHRLSLCRGALSPAPYLGASSGEAQLKALHFLRETDAPHVPVKQASMSVSPSGPLSPLTSQQVTTICRNCVCVCVVLFTLLSPLSGGEAQGGCHLPLQTQCRARGRLSRSVEWMRKWPQL